MISNIFTLIISIWGTCALISLLFMWDVMGAVDDDFPATMILHILLPYVVIWRYRKSIFSQFSKITKIISREFKNVKHNIRKIG